MKKLIVLLIALLSMQMAVADDAVRIKINIKGASPDNRYFLCLPDVGCLSILAAEKGKVYPIFRPIEMNAFYITDANNHFRVTSQRTPASCNVNAELNHTITISGKIAVDANNKVMIDQLHCATS